ncbi:RHS repeat-associated core domain-containing protein [Myroides sp. TSA_177.3]|uniref:RHS repeat-associated core domain-containing protein n=1 Tax=Myroides sp. TSA_177.3 TaxID=3415650 RepID=UPI0040465FC1
MMKQIKNYIVCSLVVLMSMLTHAQTQEIELVFDTSGYKTTNSNGIIAVPNKGNDTLPSIKGEANVSAMGGLNYTIPIDVVPGVNNFSPNLALAYNSQAGNGIAGYGWNISGLSSIVIGGKSKEIDGITIGAQHDGTDPYYLDGGRLLSTDGINFTTLLFSKIKIVKQTAGEYSFIIQYPNGKIAKYKEIQEDVHLISVMIDSFDNQVNYLYEILDNVSYLKSITYGGTSEEAPKYFVNFKYSNRKVNQVLYSNGKAANHKKVLQEIVIVIPSNNLTPYRTYDLSYDYIQGNTVERLREVEVYNEEQQKLPSLKFSYNDKEASAIVEKTEEAIQVHSDSKKFGSVVIGDFKGTGNPYPVYEIVLPDDKNDTYVKFSVYPEENYKLWSSDLLDFASYKRSRDLFSGKILVDKKVYDRTEKVISPNDILISVATDYKTNKDKDFLTLDFFDLSEGRNRLLMKSIKLDLPSSLRPHNVSGYNGFYKNPDDRYIYIGDVNNDGLADLLIFQTAGMGTTSKYYFYELGKKISTLADGQKITLSEVKGDFYSNLFARDCQVYPIEFDGDGIPEFLTVSKEGRMTLLKFNPETLALKEVRFLSNKLSDFKEKTPLIFGDFNGDGLTDFMTPVNLYSLEDSNIEEVQTKMNGEQQLWWVYTSTGENFKKEQKDFTTQKLAYIIPSQHHVIRRYNTWDKVWSGKKDRYRYTEYGSSNIIAMDVNGDGKTDLVSFRKFGKIEYKGDKILESELDPMYRVTNSRSTPKNDALKFYIIKSKADGGFELNESISLVDLYGDKISPLSFLYSKTDYNALNAYKSSLVIYDPLIQNKTEYTITLDDFVESQLKKIDNGSGVVQEIEYSPMTENFSTRGYYDRGDEYQPFNKNSYYYNDIKLPYPYYVHKTNGSHYLVSKVHNVFDNKVLTKEYQYYNAIQHLEGKGFLGFQKTKTSEVYEGILNKSNSRNLRISSSSEISDTSSRNNDLSNTGGSLSRDNSSGTSDGRKDAGKGILWNTYTYDYKMDNALQSEQFGSFDETKNLRFTEYWNERKVKPNKSYSILKTGEQIQDELTGFITHKVYYYNDNWLLERVLHLGGENNNQKEEKFTYLPEFTQNGHFFYGKIGKSQVISKREGHTFSTREEYTYNQNGAVETLKKYGNGTNPITTSYTYYPFGGVKEEKLTYVKGSYWADDLVIAEPGINLGGSTVVEGPKTVAEEPIGTYQPGTIRPERPILGEEKEELISKYEYDASNRFVVKTTAPDGLITTATVDAYGKMLTQTDALGRTTTFKYDSWGNAHTVTNYLGKSVKTKKTKSKVEGARYDVTVIGDDGSQSITSYDLLDRPIQTKTKSISKIARVLEPGGPVIEKPRDLVVQESSSSNTTIIGEFIPKDLNYWVVTRQVYDIYGNVIQSSQPFLEGETPKWNYTTYDHLHRPIKHVDFNGKITTTCYEKNKVLVEDGHKKSAKWIDDQGLVIKSQDQGGTILYKYYANGSLKEADYEGIKTQISIDGWGNKTKLVDPSAGTYLYRYDNISRLIKTTNPKGGVTTYTYNKFGQMTAEKTTSAAENTQIDIAYTYDERSKLPLSISGTYNGQSFTYSTVYDAQYRIKEKKEDTPAFTYSTVFTYDAFERVAKTKAETRIKSSGISSETVVQNAYSNGVLYKQSDEDNKMIWQLSSLTSFGGTKQINFGNGYKQVNTYNDQSQFLVNIKHSKDNNSVVDLDYSYDVLRGTLSTRTNKIFTKSEQFAYDNLDRLLTETVNGVIADQYTYDKRGRTTSNLEVGTYSYKNTDYQLQNIGLNAKGAQKAASRGFATVQYNAFKSPNEIYLEGKGRINYDFSILKNRYVAYFGSTETKENQPIKKYYSADKSLEIVLEGNKTKIITYVTGDAYSANYMKIEEYKGNVRQSSKNYYLHRDNQQSIVAITDSEGNNIEQRYFDAWGNLRAAKVAGVDQTITAMGWAPSLLIDRGYTGHEHLYTVGLIHMNGRIYDPLLRRFMSPDNYIQEVYNTQNYNRYGYVLNNPLLYTDPSGESFLAIGIAIVSAVIINGISNSSKNIPFFYGSGKAGTIAGITAVISMGIGSAVGTIGNQLVRTTVQAGAHGIVGGAVSEIEGGKFISGFAAGVASSLISSGVEALGPDGTGMLNSSQTQAVMIAGGGLSGGISSTIAGGDFWQGMRQGLITSGLNHAMHMGSDQEGNKTKEKPASNTTLSEIVIPLSTVTMDAVVTLSASSVFVLAIVGSLVKGDSDPGISMPMYRAMSYEEYNTTGGRLLDLKKKGEGPHVAIDPAYSLSLGNRLNKNALRDGRIRPYDIIVEYQIYIDAYTGFFASPYKYTADGGITPGGPVFAGARLAGLNYVKYEGGFTNLGFPGTSVHLFNSKIRKHKIWHRF